MVARRKSNVAKAGVEATDARPGARRRSAPAPASAAAGAALSLDQDHGGDGNGDKVGRWGGRRGMRMGGGALSWCRRHV